MADHQSGATGSLETVFDSTLESVDAAEALALDVATQSGFPEEDQHKIGMAVREAMVNAVVHGNRYNLKKKVHFGVSSAASSLYGDHRRRRRRFRAGGTARSACRKRICCGSPAGDLLLIKAFVDEFDMRKAPPLGTEVRLVFHRSEES